MYGANVAYEPVHYVAGIPGDCTDVRMSAADAPARLPRAMVLSSMSWPCRWSVGGTLASKGGGGGGTVHGRAGVSVWPAH